MPTQTQDQPFSAGRRRCCLGVLPAALLSVCWGAPARAVPGMASQAERAVAVVKALQASGERQPGATLRLVVKQGNIASFLGRELELQREWEALTGTRIDARLMPQLDSQAFIARDADVDLTIARTHEFADLYHDGLIEDLTPLAERFGFALDGDAPQGYLLLQQQAYLGKQLLAIPADADVPLLYLRRDLLEDDGNRERFRARYGYTLAVPVTWTQYLDQVAFFDRAAEGFYGALEQRERATGWMFWIQRYIAMSPTPRLFDADMRPLLDTPAGIEATQNYIATVPYSPPAILAAGHDYSYTLPFFSRGKGYSTIITPAGAKLFSLPTSVVKDHFIVVPLPGSLESGRTQRRSELIYGNNLVVPKRSEHKTLALLFALWLTSPAVSPRSVGVPGGFADPYRYHHLNDERVAAVYTPGALAALSESLAGVLPAGTGIPGNAEYLAALNDGVWRAAAGELTAREAMRATAVAWEATTQRRGRDKQAALYQAFAAAYPGLARADM